MHVYLYSNYYNNVVIFHTSYNNNTLCNLYKYVGQSGDARLAARRSKLDALADLQARTQDFSDTG